MTLTTAEVATESGLFALAEAAGSEAGVPVVSETPTESSVAPAAPTTLEQTGLSSDNVLGLMLKALYTGELSGRELSDQVKISYSILERIIEAARVEQLIEVRSASGAGTAGYRYAVTDAVASGRISTSRRTGISVRLLCPSISTFAT